MHTKFLARCACLALGVFICARAAYPAVFNIPDGDVAALKAALVTANGNGQVDIINLAAGRTYTLISVDNAVNGSNGLPVINNDTAGLDLTINGNGAIIERSSVAGTPEFRILQITTGAELSCVGLTIRNAKISGNFPAHAGAGIFCSQATLNLTDCVVRDNTGRFGGGIFNHGGSVTINGGTFTTNVGSYGGAIFNNLGTVTATASTITDSVAQGGGNPSAPGLGGGIYSLGTNGNATLTLTGCTFTINRTTSGDGSGGAIYNDGYLGNAVASLTNCTFMNNFGIDHFGGAIGNDTGTMTMIGCMLSNNSGRSGGAILNFEGSLDVSGTTFEQNHADGTGVDGLGGGIASIRGTVTLLNSTLHKNTSNNFGAGIYSSGITTITNSDVNENVSKACAIGNEGEMTLVDSRVNNNTSDGFGGGIYTTKTAVLLRCTVNGNTSKFAAGGGIFNGGTLTVQSSTFNGNKCESYGGAITTFSSSGGSAMTLQNSTFSNNQADKGGGISNFGGTMIFRNSTVSGNAAQSQGGGLHNLGGKATVQCDTFSANSSPSGGGIYNVSSAGSTGIVLIRNTALQGGASGVNLVNNAATFTSEGHNLSADAAGGDASTGPGGLLNGPGDIRNTFPNFGPLQDNGGLTFTHALTMPSPAIDAGDDAVVGAPISLTTDQRGVGFPRHKGLHVDIGAVESGVSLVVTTTDDHDDGVCTQADCTLREAIAATNAAGNGTISFAPGVTGTIQLAAPLPNVSASLFLQGPGPNLLTVRRNSGGAYRILTLSNGTPNGPGVAISGLTISNGQAPSGAFPADSGGGILNDRGTLVVSKCTLTGNTSALPGTTYGGAILNNEGSLTVTESSISGNTAYYGGGVASIRTVPGTALFVMRSSTINSNTAEGGFGGGICNQGSNSGSTAQVSLTNCTLSGNTASSSLFGGLGGAIYNAGSVFGNGEVSLEDCTLTGNNAPSAGGIYNNNFSASASVTLRNTILKTGTIGDNFINSSGTINSLGHNLCNDSAAGPSGTGPDGYLNAAGDIRNTNPLLGPLQDNGGRTPTHALLAGSAAINAGENTPESIVDQRSFSRLGTNDVGAFEFGGAAPSVPILSAVSRKTHGAAGSFDINLPQSGPRGVECRSGGVGGNHQVIVTFANPVSVGGLAVSSINGLANGTKSVSANVVTINLSGVANAQTLTITLSNVNNGGTIGDVVIPMGVLFGDTTGNGAVTSSDISQIKIASGQPITAARFRNDLNLSGSINASDVSTVKWSSGTALP